MIKYNYVGRGTGLITSTKTGWASGQTVTTSLYVHGGPMQPSVVRTFGITPEKASEFLVHPGGAPISGGKMVFGFFLCNGTTPPSPPEKSPAVGRLWGFDGHMYVFKVPPGVTYWSQGGRITPTAEVAFEYVIESDDIVAYWAPSKDFVSHVGAPRDPRRNFQAVSWQQYLLASAGG